VKEPSKIIGKHQLNKLLLHSTYTTLTT